MESDFNCVKPVADSEIQELSDFAGAIVKRHYDPIIGEKQNDYMIQKFQSPEALREQIKNGGRYYWITEENRRAGFVCFYPKDGKIYLSKFYISRSFRGRQLGKRTLDFIINEAKNENLSAVFLNVNKYNFDSINIYKHLGFEIIRAEKNDIGSGYFMDDYVMQQAIKY